MSDGAQTDEPPRCALPGCDAIIEQPADGGEPRRYCTAAHRMSARRLRQSVRLGLADGTGDADDFDEDVDEDADDFDEPAPKPVVPRPAARASRPRPVAVTRTKGTKPRIVTGRTSDRKRAARQHTDGQATRVSGRRRRQAIAVLGAVAILAAGQQWERTADKPAAESPGGLANPGQPGSRASVEHALVLVNAQLDQVAQTMARWHQRRWKGPLPSQVLALQKHEAVLKLQQAMLQSRLATADSLPRIAAELAAAERQVNAIDRTVAATPQTAGSPVSELTEEKSRATQRRDELARMNAAAQQAVTAPLPVITDRATTLTQDVLALPERPAPQAPADRREPLAAVAPRQDSAQDRDVTTIGAPPNVGARRSLVDPPEESTGQQSDDDDVSSIDDTVVRPSPAANQQYRVVGTPVRQSAEPTPPDEALRRLAEAQTRPSSPRDQPTRPPAARDPGPAGPPPRAEPPRAEPPRGGSERSRMRSVFDRAREREHSSGPTESGPPRPPERSGPPEWARASRDRPEAAERPSEDTRGSRYPEWVENARRT